MKKVPPVFLRKPPIKRSCQAPLFENLVGGSTNPHPPTRNGGGGGAHYGRHGLKAHGISYKYLRSWSHTLKVAIGEKFENNFCQSVQKVEKNEKNEIMTTAELLACYLNVIKIKNVPRTVKPILS